MRAVRLVEAHSPLQMQEIPVPTVGESDVLVRVRAAGICHSDVHYRAGKSPVQPLPRTLGHEIAGVVEQVGSRVRTVTVGSRACVHYVLSCGECSYCTSGFFPCPQPYRLCTKARRSVGATFPAQSLILEEGRLTRKWARSSEARRQSTP